MALAFPIDPPVADVEGLRFVLHRLAAAFGDQLEARGAAAARARLTLELDRSFSAGELPSSLTIDQHLPEPTSEGLAIERLLIARLETRPAAGARVADGTGAGRRGAGRGLPARRSSRRRRAERGGSAGSWRRLGAPLRRGSGGLDGARRSGGASARGSLGWRRTSDGRRRYHAAARRCEAAGGPDDPPAARALRRSTSSWIRPGSRSRSAGTAAASGRGLQPLASRGGLVEPADRPRLLQGRRARAGWPSCTWIASTGRGTSSACTTDSRVPAGLLAGRSGRLPPSYY